MTKRANSNRTGTLPYVKVISDDLILAAASAALEVAAVVRREALLLLPVLLQALARLPREAEAPAVEELLLRRSFSAATVGRSLMGVPRSARVPRSRPKPNNRP